jgi:glutamine amidotransferase-like uncharacterized protein
LTRVLIYQDYVFNHGALFRAVTRFCGLGNVDFCDAADIGAGRLDESVNLFIMPGGAASYYTEKLAGKGEAAIRAWVENGGTYLGLCAGAYYACADIVWAKGTDQEIIAAPGLRFFSGTATGPLFDLIENGDIARSWDGVAGIDYDDGLERMKGRVFYSGGPWFTDTDQPGVRVLARFSEGAQAGEAAMLDCAVGKGRAILVSPHLESGPDMRPRMLYRHKNTSYGWHTAMIEKLSADLSVQDAMWHSLMRRCAGQTQGNLLRHAG